MLNASLAYSRTLFQLIKTNPDTDFHKDHKLVNIPINKVYKGVQTTGIYLLKENLILLAVLELNHN